MLSVLCLALALAGGSIALTEDEMALFRPSGEDSRVYVQDNEDGSITITTNGLPSHATPLNPTETSTSLRLFKDPELRPWTEELTCLPGGVIGVSTSGATIHSWWGEEGTACPYAALVSIHDLVQVILFALLK